LHYLPWESKRLWFSKNTYDIYVNIDCHEHNVEAKRYSKVANGKHMHKYVLTVFRSWEKSDLATKMCSARKFGKI